MADGYLREGELRAAGNGACRPVPLVRVLLLNHHHTNYCVVVLPRVVFQPFHLCSLCLPLPPVSQLMPGSSRWHSKALLDKYFATRVIAGGTAGTAPSCSSVPLLPAVRPRDGQLAWQLCHSCSTSFHCLSATTAAIVAALGNARCRLYCRAVGQMEDGRAENFIPAWPGLCTVEQNSVLETKPPKGGAHELGGAQRTHGSQNG